MIEPDGHEISPPPGAFVRRFDSFETEIWADAPELARHYAALDADAQRRIFTRAFLCGDLKRVALLGPGLLRARQLIRPEIFVLGRALAAWRRWTEAAEVFEHPWISARPNPKYAIARAATLAAVGRMPEALASLDVADQTPLVEALRATISKVAALADPDSGPRSWDDIAELATAYLTLGLPDQAASHLAKVMAADPSDAPMTVENRLDLAGLALEAGLANQVAGYLAAMPEATRPRPGWDALTAAADALGDSPRPRRAATMTQEASSKSQRVWRALESEAHGELDEAIAQLCGLAEDFKLDLEIRFALARCVGKAVVAETRPMFAPGGTGRFVNVMPFFNELDLLRLHLEEMAPWVDRFVIVEAGATFTGADKPLIFEANRGMFADFADKIVHVPIRRFPAHLTSPWAREFYQRDMAIAGAAGLCGMEDYILETDVDEVIDHRALEGLEADFAALEVTLSRFFLNYRPAPGNPKRARPKASVFKAKHRVRHGLSYGRFSQSLRFPEAHRIPNAGWHFTSMFDADGLSLKARSYSHQEQTKEHFRSTDFFQSVLSRLRRGELDPGWERAELDDSFPTTLLRRREDFDDLIL